MKTLTITLLALTPLFSTTKAPSTKIKLTNTVYILNNGGPGTTSVAVAGTGKSGFISEIACVVTEAPTGHYNLEFGLQINIDGPGIGIPVYNARNNGGNLGFDAAVAALSDGAKKGQEVGDTFRIRLNVPFKETLHVFAVWGGLPATTGAVSCTAVYVVNE